MAESDGNGLEYGWTPLFGQNPDAGIEGFGHPPAFGPPAFGAPALAPAPRAPVVRPPPITQTDPVPLRPLSAYASFGDVSPVPTPPPAVPPPVPPENGHTLGLAILISGIAGAIGGKYKGLSGGAAGVLYGGAATNLIRAGRNVVRGTPDADKEALISATWALISAGVATYIWVKGPQPKGARKNASEDGEDESEGADDEEPEEDPESEPDDGDED